jgi:two-component system, OmpR family, response regulator
MRVLVVDDDINMLSLVERLLRGAGLEVTTSSSSLGVSNIVRKVEPDVVVLDLNIPALSGDALLGLLRRHAPPRTRFVLYSSCGEAELRTAARAAQADGYISKSSVSDIAAYLIKLVGTV